MNEKIFLVKLSGKNTYFDIKVKQKGKEITKEEIELIKSLLKWVDIVPEHRNLLKKLEKI